MSGSPTAGLLCPACRVDLTMADRQGVEIDYCPKCRGVWLDRGELDKILERSAAYETPAPSTRGPVDHEDAYRERERGRYGKPHKRKSLLGEIFDF